MAYRYLDRPLEDLMKDDVHLFCACGRYVRFGPEDWVRWPGSTLHRIAARMRCKGCGQRGNIPEVRLTATSTRSVGSGKYGVGDYSGVSRAQPIQSTHQRRKSRRHRDWFLWQKCPACGRHYAPHVTSAQIIARNPRFNT